MNILTFLKHSGICQYGVYVCFRHAQGVAIHYSSKKLNFCLEELALFMPPKGGI